MRAIILAGGSNLYWEENPFNLPKHLAPVPSTGEPLIHRTQRLLHQKGITDIRVVCHPTNKDTYVLPVARWEQPREIDRRFVQEMEPSRHLWNEHGRTALFYGDVFYTNELLDAMINDPADPTWRYYARWGASSGYTGCDHGEGLGWVIRPTHFFQIDAAREIAIQFVLSGSWWRCLAWEIHRLACGQPPWHHDWRDDSGRHVEWDDASDDWDTLNEYKDWASLNPTLT